MSDQRIRAMVGVYVYITPEMRSALSTRAAYEGVDRAELMRRFCQEGLDRPSETFGDFMRGSAPAPDIKRDPYAGMYDEDGEPVSEQEQQKETCTCTLRWYPNRCRVHPEKNQ